MYVGTVYAGTVYAGLNKLALIKTTEIVQETKTKDQNKAESLYGCRYSALLDLPYFDALVNSTIWDV